jgi:hypothetical protein
METQRSRPNRADESGIYPQITKDASRGRERGLSTNSESTLRRLRRELLEKILDRENERRVARAFAAN